VRRPSASTLTFLIPALIVLGVSVVLTVRRSARLAGAAPARFSGATVVQRMPSLLSPAVLSSKPRIVVVRDAAAASFYDRPAMLDSIVRTWQQALASVGADVRVVSSTNLGAARDARVLVFPSSPCLTVASREAIASATARGQGLIFTGAAGINDAGCRPLGYGLIVEASGAARVERLEPREMVYVTFALNSPLGAGIPPGARIELKPAGQIALRRLGRDAFYSDYGLRPLPAGGEALLDGAVAHAEYGRSRVVYLGFELQNAIQRPWNRDVLRLLVRNAAAWASRMPVAFVEPWPAGYNAAAVLSQDVEDQFANARHALDTLNAVGVRSSFYVCSELAQRHAQLTHDLADAGEIGTHSEDHRLLGGAPAAVQRERLALTQRELLDLVGTRSRGLRPPEEQFDFATMAAWLDAHGTYLVGANDSRVAAPELLGIGTDTLVLIGRINDDDFAVMPLAAHGGVNAVSQALIEDFRRTRALGGLYLLSYHSQLLARPELVPALARLARTIVADSAVWVTTAGEVAAWWRARSQLVVTAQESVGTTGGRLIDVRVTNRSAMPVNGAVIRVDLPGSATEAKRLVVPTLAGRATRSFRLNARGAVVSDAPALASGSPNAATRKLKNRKTKATLASRR
jgi:peptidoglycan/xylan/chitin deacetylase (PgdA/CDA1 family)